MGISQSWKLWPHSRQAQNISSESRSDNSIIEKSNTFHSNPEGVAFIKHRITKWGRSKARSFGHIDHSKAGSFGQIENPKAGSFGHNKKREATT